MFLKIDLSDFTASEESFISNTYCSVDGINRRIAEWTPCFSKWILNKYKGTDVRYEVCNSHHEMNIVRLHGPFLCELWLDIKLSKKHFSDLLIDSQKVVADNGYKNHQFGTPTNVSD